MQKKYDQLYSWVKCGMVPTYQDGQFIEENPVISRGRLSNVWLGGLVNPQALLTALRQEKAVVSKCHLSDVSMRIHLRNESSFWNVHGIMNTLGLLQSK